MRIICSKEIRSYIIKERRNEQGQLIAKPHVSCVIENGDSEHIIPDELAIPNAATRITIEGVSYPIRDRSFNISTNEFDIYIQKIDVEEVDKDVADEQLIPLIREWNAQEISKNKRMAAFCRVLGKNPEEVCFEDLALVLSPSSLSNTLDYISAAAITDVGIKNIDDLR